MATSVPLVTGRHLVWTVVSFDATVRPRDHFTPGRGWLNDPNGLVLHDGEHHLFFQHNPGALVHGAISWGHAVSTDLLDWTELPTAIAATEAQHAWSGSVVHDAANTTGLGSAATGPLVALYTAFDPVTGGQAQCVAHSTDRGRTWTAYAANPVLDVGSTSFRDPKVMRHGDGWLMVLVRADAHVVDLYRSPDLLHWTHHSTFGPEGHVEADWECPDVVRVPVEDTSQSADVLLVSVSDGAPAGGSGMQYFVGVLDDDGFRTTQPARWMDHGADFYAAISYSGDVGREPVVQAWMSNWRYAADVPARDFRGSMTLARRLSLRRRGAELVLVQRPVVRSGAQTYAAADLEVDGALALPVAARTCRVVAEIDLGTARRAGLHVRVGRGERTTVSVDRDGTVALDRTASGTVEVHPDFAAVHTARLPDGGGAVRLELVVDVASVEVFVADGEVVLTDQVFPDPASAGLGLFAEGGTAHVRHLSVHA
jgi:fructan beta-fructosidase